MADANPPTQSPRAGKDRNRLLPHQVTQVAVGLVLLAAGTLKLISLFRGDHLIGIQGAAVGILAGGEFTGGLLLLLRRPGPILWSITTFAFAIFAAVSGFQAWRGTPTCGCFGDVAVSPVWTLTLDLVLLAALLAYPAWPDTSSRFLLVQRMVGRYLSVLPMRRDLHGYPVAVFVWRLRLHYLGKQVLILCRAINKADNRRRVR